MIRWREGGLGCQVERNGKYFPQGSGGSRREVKKESQRSEASDIPQNLEMLFLFLKSCFFV